MILEIILPLFGFITGLIDSIVGGGGLISLPTLSFALTPGPHAIGTNKIVGFIGAFTALIVYTKKGNLLLKEGLHFVFWCTIGSFAGSSVSPHVNIILFQYLLIFSCPFLLFLVYKKDSFLSDEKRERKNIFLFIASAFFSGFYDGFFGPGGGTVMFLAIYFVAGFPLLNAIAISKLANSFSAGTALLTYYSNGFVHIKEGLMMATGMMVGSFIGASYASKNISKILRPALAIVSIMLMIKLISDLIK